jgi:hypothetical protein
VAQTAYLLALMGSELSQGCVSTTFPLFLASMREYMLATSSNGVPVFADFSDVNVARVMCSFTDTCSPEGPESEETDPAVSARYCFYKSLNPKGDEAISPSYLVSGAGEAFVGFLLEVGNPPVIFLMEPLCCLM